MLCCKSYERKVLYMTRQHQGIHRKVTLRDIAKATGFSINSVSHALKGKSDISLATRQIIRQSAKDLGYIADTVAGSLRSGISSTIAVILGDMSNPHFGLWVREIETAAFQKGYSTLIINTDEDAGVERAGIKTAIGKRVDGIILCPTQDNLNNLNLLKSTGIPFVLIGRRWDDPAINYVVPDEVQGGRLATRYLFDQGCHNILMLNGPSHISSASERQDGFCKAHSEQGLTCDQRYIRHVGIKSAQCQGILEQVLEEELPFDGVLAFSDMLALEAITVLQDSHRFAHRIPVVGFDDILGGLIMPVSLTSVTSADGSVAGHAVDILISLMKRSNDDRISPDTSPIQKVLCVKIAEHSHNW